MTSRSASASWLPGPLRCEVAVEGGFTVSVDEPVTAGGSGAAPQPTDFFLASIASCFALALVYSAGKRGITFGRLRVDATGHYAGNRFDTIRIDVDVAGCSAAELAPIVEAAEQICYVSNTISTGVPVTVIVAAESPAETGPSPS